MSKFVVDKVVNIKVHPDCRLDMHEAFESLFFEFLEPGAYHIRTPFIKTDQGNILLGNQQLIREEESIKS